MLRYIIGRILLIIPSLIVVIFIIFVILNITPGDPARSILGFTAEPEEVAALNKELGLDKPLMERFINYLVDAVHLDFGWSYRTQAPVFDGIFSQFPTTFKLAVLAVITASLIGIPLGIISAIRQYSVFDYTLTVGSLFLASVPGFFLGLLLILTFSLRLGLLPSSGIGSARHYILPVLTLALHSAALLARMTRTSMLETLRQDYIRTAKSKGADKRRIILHHALKPALMPIITMLGMNFAGLLGGALIIEIVFGLPGIGSIIITSIYNKDAPVILAVSILMVVTYKLIMLAVDIIQVLIDPRLKSQLR